MLLEIIQNGHLCPLAFVMLVLIRIGMPFASAQQRQWGLAIGAMTFLLCGGYLWMCWRPSTSETLLVLTLRSLCIGGSIVGLCWLALPVLAFLLRPFQDASAQLQARRAQHKAREEAKRRQQEEERRQQQALEEYERNAPERERLARVAEAQERARALEQNRRAKARRTCELRFRLLEPEIKHRFVRADVEAFVAKYLSDLLSADEVEIHAAELMELMQQHKEAVKPSRKIRTMQELDAWYQQERQVIEASLVDDPQGEIKESRLYLLQVKYDEIMKSLLQEMNP